MRSEPLALAAALLAVAVACEDSFRPSGMLGPPDSVVAIARSMRLVSVHWVADAGAMGYRIERRANLEGAFAMVREVSSGFVTSLEDETVEPGTTYGYRVRTLSTNGAVSAPSLVAGARTPPWPGIRVATSTPTPEMVDPDGYGVTVVGPTDTLRALLAPFDAHEFTPLPVGAYDVTLTGVAANCHVAPDSSIAVTVVDQGLETLQGVSFIVSCRDPDVGRLGVSVATTGDSLDADGYTLTLSGLADDTSLPDSQRAYFARDSIGVQFSRTYEQLRPGNYALSLEGVAGNCAVNGPTSVDFRVEVLADVQRAFAVRCEAPDDPTRPLVWRSTWSAASAPPGQHVTLRIGLDLSRRPGQDVAAVQSTFTYDPSVVRLDSAVREIPWQATFNTATAGTVNWLAFVNGTGPTDSTTFARFYFTVIGTPAMTTTTATTIEAATDGTEHNLLSLIRRVEGTVTVSTGSGGQNQPPVARPGGPYTATAGQSVTLNGTASSDPDGTIVSHGWAFGDGASGTGVTAAHVYAAAGTYTATLTVVDNQGATATATATVTVTASGGNQPPVAVANGPYSGAVSVPVAFTSAGSADPDGSITTYQWTFGDGSTASGGAPSHAYASAGTYSVGLTVTDNHGATGSATAVASISSGSTQPFTWQGAFGPVSGADSLVTLTITLDLSTDIPQTTGPEALQSWTVDSLQWDPSVLRYFAFNFGPGGAGSVNPTDALSRGTLLFSGVQPAGGSTGVITIATIKFKVIGAPGHATTTATTLGLLLGASSTGSFSYGTLTAVREGTFVFP